MYKYEDEKPKLLTDEGQRTLMNVRNFVLDILKKSGAITMGKAMSAAGCGDSWTMMAYVDRLVELGDIREVKQEGYVPAQYRIFMAVRG